MSKITGLPFIKKILSILFFLTVIILPLFSANQDVLFIVDLSKSMNQQDLFSKVRSSLKEYIQQSEIGDRVIVLGFGEDVTILLDETIGSIEDIRNVLKNIDNFHATEDWTYMTKALDLAARNIKDLQGAYPRRSKIIYILTDGKNDPPPDLKESPITFEDIISRHFDAYAKEGTYTYIITYGITPEPGLKKFADEIKVPVSIRPPSPEKPLPPQIILSPKFILKEVDAGDYLKIPVEMTIDRLYLAKGAEMQFKISEIDFPEETEIGLIEQQKILCEAKGQKINLNIWIKNLRKEGIYKANLIPETSDSSITLVPNEIAITIKTKLGEEQIILINPKNMKLKQKIADQGEVNSKFSLNFENKTSTSQLLLFFIEGKDESQRMSISPDKIELKTDKSDIEFKITGRNYSRGNYEFKIRASTPNSDLSIEPQYVNLALRIFTSADFIKSILIWIIPIALLIAIIIFLIYCKFLIPKFEGMYLLSGGLDLRLEDYRSLCSRKIVLGKDVNFGLEEGAFAILRLEKSLECLIKPLDAEKIIVDGREVETEVPLSKGSVIKYKNIEFTFERREE